MWEYRQLRKSKRHINNFRTEMMGIGISKIIACNHLNLSANYLCKVRRVSYFHFIIVSK